MPSQPSPLMAGTCRIGRFRPNCSLEREQEDGAFRILRPRGREWVVLPESTAELLMLRPIELGPLHWAIRNSRIGAGR